jgi:plastocyanin
MAGQNWSITITGCPASFDPDVYGTEPGQPLEAQLGDLVSWNNQTDEPHQIWLTDENGEPVEPAQKLTDEIEQYTPSFPGYVPQVTDIRPEVPEEEQATTKTGTIYYYCSIHPEEQGQITVVAS